MVILWKIAHLIDDLTVHLDNLKLSKRSASTTQMVNVFANHEATGSLSLTSEVPRP